MSSRVDWHTYFMNIARQAATRSTCDRKHVGAVIVRDKTILSTGYNGSIRGMPHCDDVGHLMENGHCVATVHAEANAIIQAAKNGVRIDGAELYTTASPCWPAGPTCGPPGASRAGRASSSRTPVPRSRPRAPVGYQGRARPSAWMKLPERSSVSSSMRWRRPRAESAGSTEPRLPVIPVRT